MKAAITTIAWALAAGSAGAAVAQLPPRCAACHLPSGAGVPGAFPAIRAEAASLAAVPDGRRYLVLAVTRGVSGPIVSDGKPYRGVMPAQAGMADAEVARTLNIMIDDLAKAGPGVKRFTAAEVSQLRMSGAELGSSQVGQLRARLP